MKSWIVSAVRWPFVLAFFLFLMASSIPTYAACSGNLAKSAPIQLLQNGQYAQLDAEMNAAQKDFENGHLSDAELLGKFRAFYVADPALEPDYIHWVEKYPKSYAANLAMGIYHKYLGRKDRGCDFASNVSDSKMASMELYLAQAGPNLETSLKLTKKPVVTYVHLIDIAALEGNRQAADDYLRLAISVDPRDFIVRRKFMGTLQARWLGNPGDMKALYTSSVSAGLNKGQLAVLQSMVSADEAWVKSERESDEDGAIKKYAEAFQLADGHAGLFDPAIYTSMLQDAVFLLIKHDDCTTALKYLDAYIQTAPDSFAYSDRASCNLNLGRNDTAVVDLTRAADLGDAWSQNQLGEMYESGQSVTKNLTKSRALFQQAANQGYEDAISNLKTLPQ